MKSEEYEKNFIINYDAVHGPDGFGMGMYGEENLQKMVSFLNAVRNGQTR